jgi:pyrroloquinoline quinone (PQQ) biosynthesis protein C
MSAQGAGTLDAVKLELARDPFSESSSWDSLRSVAEDAHRLAKAAFADEDGNARRAVEAILHEIHVSSGFAAPCRAMPSVVRGILAEAKLADLARRYPVPAALDERAMAKELETLVERLGAHNHPVIDRMTAPDAWKRGLSVFSKNWFGSTNGFTEQLTSLAQHCETDARKSILRNLADELQGTPHDDMRARFLGSLRVAYDAGRAHSDEDFTTEAFALLNMRTLLCGLPQPQAALGAFYSIEANWPLECARLLKRVRPLGIDDHALEAFVLHAEVDTEHAAEWLEVVSLLPMDDRARARVVWGAAVQLGERRRMYDAIERRLTR